MTSEEKTVPAINEDSSTADVAAYVFAKLGAKESAKELRQFIIDQEIDGGNFLTLTNEQLKDGGLAAGGKRANLLRLVDEVVNSQRGKDLRIAKIHGLQICFETS